jgi:tRNA A22 N-methylase
MSWSLDQDTLDGAWAKWSSPWARWRVERGIIPDGPRRIVAQSALPNVLLWRRHGLSPRLADVASLCPRGDGFIDIGTDHARLPIALYSSGHVPVSVGVDINEAPLEIASRRRGLQGLDDDVILALGDGFDALKTLLRGSVNSTQTRAPALDRLHRCWAKGQLTVGICGVGGEKVSAMIEECPSQVGRLIVQPNLHHERVSRAFISQGRGLPQGRLCVDQGRLFLTLWTDRSDAPQERSPASETLSSRSMTPLIDHCIKGDPLEPLWHWIHRRWALRAVRHMSAERDRALRWRSEVEAREERLTLTLEVDDVY